MNQSENYICDNYKMLKDIRSQEEFQHELNALKKRREETKKQRQDQDAKTNQEETEKQQRYWDELRKKRINRVYTGIEGQCNFLRNIDIDTWFAIKPAIQDKGVYIRIQVPCKFLRKTFKLGL